MDQFTDKSLRRGALLLIAAMGLLLVVGTFLKGGRLTTNPRSRVITVERLVDAGTWAHVAPGDTTPFELSIDAVMVGDRLYSSKPPLYPLVMAGEAMAVKAVTGMGFFEHKLDYLRILVLLNQVLPYLLMLWVAFLWMRDWTRDPWVLYFMLLSLGIGLLPYGYAATINNHTVSAYLFFFAAWLVYRVLVRGEEHWGLYLGTGLMVGSATAIELPAGAMAAWLVALLLYHNWQKGVLAVVGGLVPFVPTLFIYHHLSGKWVPFYLQSDLYHYEGSYWDRPEGLDVVRPTAFSYAFHSLFGFRGLFSLTPLLLTGVWALLARRWREVGRLRWMWWGLAGGMLAIILFVQLRTHNYGGDCIGMRWFIVFMPLLMLMGLPVVTSLRRSRWGRVALVGGLVWSLPWNVQAIYEEAFIRGWFEDLWGSIFW